uniref:Uncharacterized protein n=1 Tax=Tanacetum cinerariifolium TaxID=118510 RepID=A0A699HRT7_TANCI|nr:hypothetical protein [Tanacetum cinerariifolium]
MWILSTNSKGFTSLQALSNLHYLFSGFMDYFWSCKLNISNFGPTNMSSALLTIKCLEWCCLNTGMVTVIGRKFYQWDEMCGFGKAIDNNPYCVMSV